jgi:hypothetical protein
VYDVAPDTLPQETVICPVPQELAVVGAAGVAGTDTDPLVAVHDTSSVVTPPFEPRQVQFAEPPVAGNVGDVGVFPYAVEQYEPLYAVSVARYTFAAVPQEPAVVGAAVVNVAT